MSEQRAELLPWNMTLEQCQEALLQCLTQGVAGHYRIGLLYNHIVAHRLAVKRGYRTTRVYFRKHVRVLSQSTLTRYGAVAQSFSQAVCEKYGMEGLGALLEYQRLACVYLSRAEHAEPGGVPIEIPRREGLRITKPFADCTAEDLKEAVQARRAWPGHGPLEAEGEPLQRYIEMLGQHFKDNSRCPPTVDGQVHNRRAHLRIRHLRLWDLARLTEALKPTLKPAAGTAVVEQPVVLARTFN